MKSSLPVRLLSESEIKRAAQIFIQSHRNPYEATKKLAESARIAKLHDHHRYWEKVSSEIRKLEQLGN